MTCLALLASGLCLISPTDLTLRADVSTQVSGDFVYYQAGHNYGGAHVGRVTVELPLALYRRFTLTASFEHSSLLDTTGDRGQERVSLGLVWRPLR